MSTVTGRKTLIYISTLLCLTMSLLIGSTAKSAHPMEDIQRPAFLDPSRQVQMPEDWIQKPVIHKKGFQNADLVISFNQQIYHTFLPIIQGYAREHGLNIVVEEGYCGNSAGALASKSIDMGMYCCPPGPTDRLPGLRFHTLGITAIALLVHPDNPIESITIKQARDIFQGEIYRWSEVQDAKGNRGSDLPIRPIARLHCKKRPGHWRLLLDNEDLFTPRLKEVGAIPDMISVVSANPGTIGYETLWMAHHRYKQKGGIKALKIDGRAPNEFNHLISGRYPLYRVFSITTWEGKNVANPHAQKLVDHLLQKFKSLDSKLGIIPASRLRKAGWIFNGSELVGEPGLESPGALTQE